MQWNLRLRAAERGIWKSAELRRMLAEAGRLDDLDVLCAVLGCTTNDLMGLEPEKVASRRPRSAEAANGQDHAGHPGGEGGADPRTPTVPPRLGTSRSRPPL